MRPSFDHAAFHTAHTPHPGLAGQFVQQRLGLLQVGGIETFGEPVVDFSEHGARLVATISFAQQPREARSRTQLQGFRAHTVRQRECCAEVSFGWFELSLLRLQLATQAKCLGLDYLESVRTIWLQDLFDRFKRVANGARQRLGLC